MQLVFIDDGADRRHFGHLVTERFGISAVEVLTALPAVSWLALDHLAELFGWNQGANTAKVTGLPAPILPRGRSGRSPLDRRGIRGRRLGGVGRVFVEPFLQGGNPLLEGTHQFQDSRLGFRRKRVPNFLWQWWLSRHAALLLNSDRKVQYRSVNGYADFEGNDVRYKLISD